MNKTSNFSFKGFKDVNWETVLGRFLMERTYPKEQRVLKNLLKTIIDPIFPKYEYYFDNHGSKLFFFISSNNRENVTKSFETVRSLKDGDFLSIFTKGRHHNVIGGLYVLICLVPLWAMQIRKIARNFNEFFWLMVILQQIYTVEKELRKIDIDKYKALFTYYDSLEPEAYVVQCFKKKGITTVSLQHGQFTDKCDESFIDSGVELHTFNSDYLLCWNKFTFDEAVKSGISPEKLVIAGIWSYINKKRAICRKNHNGIFGVVIGHPSFEQENLNLIAAANNLSEKYGLKYYLKLHPFYKEDHFSKNVNGCYLGNIKKGIPMLDYANQVDFTLIGSTSVFVELIYIGHDVYRYSSGEANDKYKSIKIGKYFNCPDEINTVYLKEKEKDYTEQLFDYLCTVADVTTEYKRFLDKFL